MHSTNSHGFGESCIVRTTELRCSENAGLAGNELQILLHRIRICNQEIFFLPFFVKLQDFQGGL